MNHNCPLCLRPLDESQTLVRFCSDHPELEESFTCLEANLREMIFCPESTCRVNGSIGFPGVFLRHLGCVAPNPFFGLNDVMGQLRDEDSNECDYHAPDQTIHQFSHWEIGMLRYTPHKHEMWFPTMLLRSTMQELKGKRMGVLVELAGAPGTGKTTIAMQSMDEQGYVPDHHSDRIVELGEFIYSRPHRDVHPVNSPFIGALCLRARHRDNDDHVFQLSANERGTGDLKTVFIRESPEKPRTPQKRTNRQRSLMDYAKLYLFNPLWDIIRDRPGTWGAPARGETWFSVTFYDTAGDEHQSGDFSLQAIEAGVDKVAIVIDGLDIFRRGGGESLRVARNRLPELRHKGIEHCLVVTHMDKIFPYLPTEYCREIEKMANELANPERYRVRSRQFLLHWIKNLTEKLDFNKSELRSYLEINPIPVFFVWTEGLEHRGLNGYQPISHGLAQFICWCLDVDWDRINQKPVR